MFKRYKFIIIGLMLSLNMMAQGLSENAHIYLLSCAPGEELYARYGHTALRVQDKEYGLDVVFNYGLFSFETEHFYWKFMRGETWYQLGVETTQSFTAGYMYLDRPVYTEELNLSWEEKNAIFEALRKNYEPENRYYLYNFVFDNCATRPYRLIQAALADSIHSDYKGYEGKSYREFISYYTGKHSWTDFGINLLFGPKADQKMQNEDRLFLPEELMNYVAAAKREDGSPLMSTGNIAPFVIKEVAWYETWFVGLAAFILLMVLVNILDIHKHKLSIWIDSIFIAIYVAILLLVTFLTFFSVHPLVGFGWRLLIFPIAHLCTRLIYIFQHYFSR